MVILGKDVFPMSVTRADFLFMPDGQFYITAGDDEGVIRLLEYDPKGLQTLSLFVTCSRVLSDSRS